MSAVPSPVPSEPATVDDALEVRIRAAEHRLVEREEQLQQGLQQLFGRVQAAAQPRRWLPPVLGVVVAGVGLWWVLRRPPRAAPPMPVHAASPARHREWQAAAAELPWAALLGMLWPLLPARWRTRVSPAGAATAIGIALPLLQRVSGRGAAAHAPLETMPQVDLARYAGTWHEIARLPEIFEAKCIGQPSATYLPRGAGLAVINRCETSHGPVEAQGEARVVRGGGGAKLEVSLWPQWLRALPFAWAKYWILYVDAGYRVALVGHPNRRFLWVLSRTRTLSREQVDALVALAQERGFPVERLQFATPGIRD